MSRIPIIFALLAICSRSILLACADDDEFAEFDDFVPGEQVEHSNIEVVDDSSQRHEPARDLKSPSKVKTGPDEDVVVSDKSVEQEEEEQKIEENGHKKPDLKLVNAPLPRIYKWESYYIEIAFLLACLLYFVNYFVGSSKNHKLAQQWYEQTKDILKQQFTLVGGAPQINDGAQKRDEEAESSSTLPKKQRGLIKSTESMYTLWNSGRVGLDGLLVEISLLKRQDLCSMALNLIKPTSDSLILRFLLSGESYENFVFCLAHKKVAPKLARDMVDINTFCPKRKPLSQYGIDTERLFVMSELSDVASFILDQKTISFLKKYEQSIKYIHITDQFSTVRSEDVLPAQKLANSKRMATFAFDFPRNATDRSEYLLQALSILDRLRRFKLARDSKQKSDKNRQKITDIIQKTAFSQRQEAAQNKKEELRRLEKERIYNEDDPEKQRRWEKKEARRELKKNKMRVKQLKVQK